MYPLFRLQKSTMRLNGKNVDYAFYCVVFHHGIFNVFSMFIFYRQL